MQKTVRVLIEKLWVRLLIIVVIFFAIWSWIIGYIGSRHTHPDYGLSITSNMTLLAKALMLYTNDYAGRFPYSQRSAKNQEPCWITALIRWNDETRKISNLSQILKSPLDKTPDLSSFELNPVLYGCVVRDIPSWKMKNIIMLSEKHYPGNRGYRYYLDGGITRTVADK